MDDKPSKYYRVQIGIEVLCSDLQLKGTSPEEFAKEVGGCATDGLFAQHPDLSLAAETTEIVELEPRVE